MPYSWPERFWDHQRRGCQAVVDAIAQGKRRIIFTSPTGGGKTACLAAQIERADSEWWNNALYTCRRLLFDQTAAVLDGEGIEYGLRAAGHKPALLRSTQLIMTPSEYSAVYRKKRRELHPAQLVQIDEIHMQNGGMMQQIIGDHYGSGAIILAYTATPIDVEGEWDELVVAGTNSELRRCGALVPAYTYCPDYPDLKHVKNYRVGEDLTDRENHKVMMRPGVFGRVYQHWERLNPEHKPTLLFGPDVAGSLYFAQEFHKKGVRAAHIDAKQIWYNGEFLESDDETRQWLLKATETGEVEVLCNRYVCLDDETEVLTDRGWASKDTITKEHRVANWDRGRIFFSPPREIIRRQRGPDEPMVVLETPRRSIRVTASHDLLYRTTRDGDFLKSSAASLVGRAVGVPVSGIAEPLACNIEQPDMLKNLRRRITANSFLLRQRGYGSQASRIEAERRLHERASLRYKEPRELSPEECEFIGFWIGDGNRQRLQTGGVEYRLSQTIKCPRIIQRIDDLCCAIGVDYVKRERAVGDGGELVPAAGGKHIYWSLPRGTGFGSQKRRGLFSLEPYLNKDGTNLFWGLDTQQFDALMRGLWTADGTCHNDIPALPPVRLSICGVNEKLFDLLQAIATCRGYRASIRSYKQTNRKYRNLLHLSMTKTDEHRMTKYRLRLETAGRKEEVWCVASDSGNIITRRKGSVTVMGNCREGINLPHLAHCIFACVFGSLKTYIQAGGRALRAHPSISEVVIQDHGGNYLRHGSLNADREWFLGQSGYKTTGLRQDAMRENPEQEPITCPRCGMMRLSGPICPKCGYACHRRSKMVVQVSGELKLVEGPSYRPHRTKMEPDTEQKWISMYHRARSKKWDATFNQAMALFYRENFYWPPKDLPFMPTQLGDFYEKVADTPRERLR